MGFIGVFGMFFFLSPANLFLPGFEAISQGSVQPAEFVLWDVTFSHLVTLETWALTNGQEHYAANLAVQPNQHRCIAFENPGLQAF